MGVHESFVAQVPSEVLLLIFRHVDPVTLARCQRVCTTWRWFLDAYEEELWRPICIRLHIVPPPSTTADDEARFVLAADGDCVTHSLIVGAGRTGRRHLHARTALSSSGGGASTTQHVTRRLWRWGR